MDYSNYTVFELIKYKIEFLECLEYSLITCDVTEKEVEQRLNYLSNDFKEGMYNEIISSLFTSYKLLNEPISLFLKKYSAKKTNRIIKNKKVKKIVKYNESLIDCFETFNYIINAFFEEDIIVEKLNNKLIDLSNITNEHFYNFLFLNTYTLYLNYLYNKDNVFQYNKKDIQRIIGILHYCNKTNKFKMAMDSLKDKNEKSSYNELNKISNNCIELEKKQQQYLKEFIDIINNECEK